MTPTDLRAVIAQLGTNQTKLGRWLGHSDGREVRRWLACDAKIPIPVIRLLRLMARLGLSLDDVDALPDRIQS